MTGSKNVACIGAFMMEGLRDLAGIEGITYREILEAWGDGCLEMVQAMTEHAPLVEVLYTEALNGDTDFPGVFDYEVSAMFGRWFGKRIYHNAETGIPTDAECEAKVRELVAAFFGQGE